MRKDTFDEDVIFNDSSTAVPYFGSELDQNISNEEYISNLYSSNVVSNMRNRSIRDSEINYGIRKCYLPSLMSNVNNDITYITSLYKYYNIPIPESGVTPTQYEIYIANKSNGEVARLWWCRTYRLDTLNNKYYNYGRLDVGQVSMVIMPRIRGFVRPIINLSNYTKVRFENGNYYID